MTDTPHLPYTRDAVRANRGRMIPVDVLLQLLPPKADGSPIWSRRWAMESFCRDKRQKLGKFVFWYEADVKAAGITVPDILPSPTRRRAA